MENDQLTTAEMRKLMAVLRELDDHAPRENRQEDRRKVLVELKIRPIKKRQQDSLPALIANISSQGLGLFTDYPLDIDSRFITSLRFEDGGGWLVLCEVKNCRPGQNGCHIGALLVDRIDDPKGQSTPPMDWLL